MEEQEKIKTAAELEAEARQRARAEITDDKKGSDKPPAGQPKVVQHNKPKGKRTLIVCIVSLVLLVALATGGDYLMGMLKGGKSKKEETKAPSSSSTSSLVTKRHGLGQDSQPFETPEDETTEDAQPSGQAAPPAPPLTFNKVSAVASFGPSSSSQQSQRRTDAGTGSANTVSSSQDASLVQCKQILRKGADGRLYCPDADKSAAGQDSGIARVTGVRRLNLDPNLYIPVDRHIPCTVMQRFVSDVAGRLNCMISEDLYSANNMVPLIPAGSIARLIYRTGTLKNGMGRLFIGATEIRTPEPGALSIPMMDSQAVGQLGENGVTGWIDNHWWERIGNTLMLGTVQDFAAAAADSAPGKDRNTDYTENTRTATAELAKAMLDSSINIPPTMYLNQGDVIGLTTGADIDFSDVLKLKAR